MPYVDYLLYRHPRRGRIALNIGGIANITAIPAGASPEDVKAFDTGPGNMVIDALVQRHSGGKLRYDRDGRIAARGKVLRDVLDRLLADPYYRRKPPKIRRARAVRQGVRCGAEGARRRPDRHRHGVNRRHHRAGRSGNWVPATTT